MIADLKSFIIFLHGLAGSGKGEMQRKLADVFGKKGYSVIYASSGDLFRAAFSNPVIAEQVRKGYYLDTLGAIMPGLQAKYEEFVKQWASSKGKAVFVLDGVIRRGEFTNKVGQHIPSQIEQIAQGFHKSNTKLIGLEQDYGETIKNLLSEYSEELPPETILKRIEETMIGATHFVLDVKPEDAEAQMKRRADKEIGSIRTQLQSEIDGGRIAPEQAAAIAENLVKMESLLHCAVKIEGGNLHYIPLHEANDQIPMELFQPIAQEVQTVRRHLAKIAGVEESSAFTVLFAPLGIATEIRDDDISPIGRETRISNYIQTHKVAEGRVYSPGFASQALIESLGFTFLPDGCFQSRASNYIVITNGQSRDIGLEELRARCASIAQQIYTETESTRARLFESIMVSGNWFIRTFLAAG